MISTYIDPFNKSLEHNFESVIEDLIVVKDNDGNVFLPEFNFDGIGTWDYDKGFQVKMEQERTISIKGISLPIDTIIEINSGWNLISYLLDYPNDINIPFSDFINDIIIIKDGLGNLYIPEYNYNSIGNMRPGKGYKIKTINPISLSYESGDSRLCYEYASVEQLNSTDQNMQVIIPKEAWSYAPQCGSEIFAFDQNGLLVGKSTYNSELLAFTIWGDDMLTSVKEGMFIDEPVQFILSDLNGNYDIEIPKWKRGSSSYKQDAINIAESVTINLSESVSIDSTRSLVRIVNVLGQEVSIENSFFKGIVYFEIYDDGSVEKIVK